MIYGIWRYPANLLILINLTIIIDTSIISNKIQRYAKTNNLNEKKTNDHNRLTTNWIIYILGISFISSYMIYEDTPIKIYSIVQTTGKIHDGIMLSTLFGYTAINPTKLPNKTCINIKIISLL